jgi:hypothetical protein
MIPLGGTHDVGVIYSYDPSVQLYKTEDLDYTVGAFLLVA